VRLLPITLLLCALPTTARAYDFDIYSETIGQGYQLRAADDTLVNRRRLTQYLGLEVYNLGPRDEVGRALDRNQFYLSTSMRFDAELGDFANYRELSGHSPQREFQATHFDLLWAYLGGRNLFGFIDMKLGRQVFLDPYEFRALDGLDLDFKTRFHVGLEVWGGLNVTGEAPVDSPIYRADGVALGGNFIGSLGQRQENALEPTFGFALHSIGVRDLTVRISYFRTMSLTGDPKQPGENDLGVNEEKLSVTARGRLLKGRLLLWAGFRYDALNGLVDQVHAGARLQLADARHGINLEYVYDAPTFDGDSIWNVFGSEAFNDIRLSYDLAIGRWRGYARAFARIFANDQLSQRSPTGSIIYPPNSLDAGVAYGGSLGAWLDLKRGYVRLDAYYEDGYGGIKTGVDASGRVALYGNLQTGLVAEARLDFVHFQDDSRTIDHADSFGVQAGLRYSFLNGITVHVLLEENVNRFYDSQLRLLAVLDVAWWLGPRSTGYTLQRPGLF
jgi:hypothetical protein